MTSTSGVVLMSDIGVSLRPTGTSTIATIRSYPEVPAVRPAPPVASNTNGGDRGAPPANLRSYAARKVWQSPTDGCDLVASQRRSACGDRFTAPFDTI